MSAVWHSLGSRCQRVGVTNSHMPNAFAVAAVQPECVCGDLAGNVARHVDAVRMAQVRLVVFPELSLTGYELEAEAVLLDDPVLTPLVHACTHSGSLALVGAPVRGESGREHIAMLAVDQDGVRVAYCKMYLGDQEAKRFVPGPGPVVIEVDGWRLGLAICKDTGVPEHAEATAAPGDGHVRGRGVGVSRRY